MSPPSSLSLVQRNHTGGIGAASVVGEDHHHHHHNHHPSRRLLLEAEEGVTDDKEEEAMASSKNCYLTGEEDHGSIGQMVYDFIGQAVKMVEESERKEKIQMMDNMMMIHNGGHDDNHGADNGQDEESDSESCVPSLLCSSILKSSINVPLFSPVASTSSSTLGIHGLSENTCFNSTIPIVMSPPSPSEMEMTTTTTTGSVVINTTIDDNEDDSSTNNMNIELLTPPATDPDSPASETIIGLIPDEVCLLESEDSKVAIDESTCQSSSTCQASSSSSSATTNGSSSSMVCKWRNCDWPGTYDDLVDHIREIHVELQPYHNHRHIVSKSSLNDSSNNDDNNNNNQDDEIDLVPTAFSAISAKSVRSDANDRDSRRSMDDESTSQYQLRTKSAAISSPNHSEENQQYVCLWQGCKVYGKGSSSRNWLERHVLLHSGPRPFKCIFDQCGSRFKSRPALEKHVNSHFNGSFIDTGSNGNSICGDDGGSDIFNDNSGPMMMRAKSANGGDQNHHHHHHHHRHHHNNHNHNQQRGTSMSSSSLGLTTPNKLLKRKKVSKPKRKCVNLKSSQDFFDLRVMEHVQYSLCQLNAITGVDISGHQREITFHTRVIARRKEDKSGQCKVLLHYHPENILPDVWVPESQLDELKVKTLPLSHLPSDALAELMELSPVPREGRKQRRK